MSFIYKTGRAELLNQIQAHSKHITGRVLDVGSGSSARYRGFFTYSEYIRMDIAPGNNVDIVGKIEAIPLEDTSVDSIVCTQVIGDVFDLHTAFQELYRVLRKGGKLLLTENLYDSRHDEPYDFWRFTQFSLRKLAEDAGFTVITLEPRGGYHSVKAQMRARYWIERLNANSAWFARPLSILFKIQGIWARFLDRHDKSRACGLFTHGYILIAEKHV